MVCCLLDVCGLWLCLSPISVFAVVRMSTCCCSKCSLWSATLEATAAAGNLGEEVGWMSRGISGQVRKSVQPRLFHRIIYNPGLVLSHGYSRLGGRWPHVPRSFIRNDENLPTCFE